MSLTRQDIFQRLETSAALTLAMRRHFAPKAPAGAALHKGPFLHTDDEQAELLKCIHDQEQTGLPFVVAPFNDGIGVFLTYVTS